MKESKSIKKNFFYQFFYQILISILPFITSPYIARVLGASQIGIYSYVYSIVVFFILVANLGIANYGNRLVAQNRDNKNCLNKEFSSLFYFHVIISVIVILAYLIYLECFVTDNKAIYAIQMIFIVAAMLDISWLFFGEEDFKSTTIRNTVVKVLNCILVFVCVKRKEDLLIYTSIMSLGTLCSQLILWPFAFKYIRIVKVSFFDIFKHINRMIALFGATLATAIYSYMDKIMIGKMSSMSQLGFYENGWKLIEFPVGFITALGTVMLPKMANMIVKKDYDGVKKYIEKSMYISMISASAIAFGIASISKEFSVIFWGKEFVETGGIISIMAICIVFMSWNGVIRNQYLIPKEKDKEYLIAVIVASIVNLISNYILIPILGGRGAAIGTALSYFAIFVIQNFYIRKELPIINYLKKSIPLFLIGFIMYTIISFINIYTHNSIIGLLIKICIGGGTYVVLLFIYGIIFKNSFVIELYSIAYKKLFNKKKCN